MEVKFSFNIEICHLQNELWSLRCLNTFLEDYSEWNSLGLYSPSLTKCLLASASPATAKRGWNSISVILPLPLLAEESHIQPQTCPSHLTSGIWKPVKPLGGWQYWGRSVRRWEPRNTTPTQLQYPTAGWCSLTASLLHGPPELARSVA